MRGPGLASAGCCGTGGHCDPTSGGRPPAGAAPRARPPCAPGASFWPRCPALALAGQRRPRGNPLRALPALPGPALDLRERDVRSSSSRVSGAAWHRGSLGRRPVRRRSSRENDLDAMCGGGFVCGGEDKVPHLGRLGRLGYGVAHRPVSRGYILSAIAGRDLACAVYVLMRSLWQVATREP